MGAMSLAPESHVGATILRGSPKRLSNFKEQLQESYVRAVAAAAGCVVSAPGVDEGVDLQLTHRSSSHLHGTAALELQLKATERYSGTDPDYFDVVLGRDNFDFFRYETPTVHRVVVVMNLPRSVDDWLSASHDHLRVHHAAYWVSIRGREASDAQNVTVRVPRTQVFDDVALCNIMARIGQGGAP